MYQESKIVMYDDVVRRAKNIIERDCTKEFLKFVENTERNRIKWKEAKQECIRLKGELDAANAKITKLEKMLNTARISLDKERKNTLEARCERDVLRDQVAQIDDILSTIRHAGDKLANETKEKLEKFITMTHTKLRQSDEYGAMRLDTIDEINSTERVRFHEKFSSSGSLYSSSWSVHTGSLLSDREYTRSEDTLDLDASFAERGTFKKPKRSVSPTHDEVPVKKRKSARLQNKQQDKITKKTSEHLIATTTVTVPKKGPVTACSTIETFPEGKKEFVLPSAPPKTSSDTDSDVSEAIKNFPCTSSSPNMFSNNRLFTRPHCFRSRTVLKPSEECGVCLKKITFGNKIFLCPDCRVACHADCRDKVPLPCIAVVETPRGNSCTTIGDYCSKSTPMIPALIIHCVMEVEDRGLNEVGIYRVPGSERDVRALKDRFLRGKGVGSLSGYDIHVVCGTIKDFLRNLSEPLVTYALWPEFIRASEENDPSDRTVALYQAISQLPQPNRDTLAFLMIHLQKVSQSPDCKMSKSNLARMFGPTIVGYSSADPPKSEMYLETAQQAKVIECFLDIPTEYWDKFVKEEYKENIQAGAATPIGSIALRKRNRDKARKIFSTPPVK